MRYIKVWHQLEDVPQELRGDVETLVGTYFCLEDVIDSVNMRYGDAAWDSLSPQEQEDAIREADKMLENLVMEGSYGWDEAIRDSISDSLPEVQAKLEEFGA